MRTFSNPSPTNGEIVFPLHENTQIQNKNSEQDEMDDITKYKVINLTGESIYERWLDDKCKESRYVNVEKLNVYM